MKPLLFFILLGSFAIAAEPENELVDMEDVGDLEDILEPAPASGGKEAVPTMPPANSLLPGLGETLKNTNSGNNETADGKIPPVEELKKTKPELAAPAELFSAIEDPSVLLDVESLPELEKSNSKPPTFNTLPAPVSRRPVTPPLLAGPPVFGPMPPPNFTPTSPNTTEMKDRTVTSEANPYSPMMMGTGVQLDTSSRKPVPFSTPMIVIPGVADIAVILAAGQFFPSRIRIKAGMQVRLLFTTTGKKPAALMIEKLQIQRWIAKENERPQNELEKAKLEIIREVLPSKVTEVIIEPINGTYSFHDAVSGASGEIIAE